MGGLVCCRDSRKDTADDHRGTPVPAIPEEHLERIRGILPALRAASADIEAARQLPPEIAETMRAAGVFGAAVPGIWGGPELDPLTQARAVELLAEADGSAGW